MRAGTYTIRGGTVGRERLRVLSAVMAPTTATLLDRVGIPGSATCIDVGCGGGEVTAMLATRAIDGRVIGTDADEVKVELAGAEAAANVELIVEDVATTVERGLFVDVVYARFLLSHLGDGRRWVRALGGLLAPGGVLIIEDTHIAGAWCAPRSAAFERASTSTRAPCGPTAAIRTSARSSRRTWSRPGSSTSVSTSPSRRPWSATASGSSASRSTRCVTRPWPPGRPTMRRSTASSPSSTPSSGGPTRVVTTAQVVQTWGRRPR